MTDYRARHYVTDSGVGYEHYRIDHARPGRRDVSRRRRILPGGTPMNEFNEPGRPARPLAGRSRAMKAGVGIFLIAAGAILRFAITTGSPHGLNVHIVGIILILAGVLGMIMPGSARARLRPGLLRTRWVSPGQAVAHEEPPAGADPGGYYDDGQPLADDLPG
jgi:hypothetical protein